MTGIGINIFFRRSQKQRQEKPKETNRIIWSKETSAQSTEWRANQQDDREYLQVIWRFISRKEPQKLNNKHSRNGRRIWTQISQKKHKWKIHGKCSTSLVSAEMQTEIAVRHHLSPSRAAVIYYMYIFIY